MIKPKYQGIVVQKMLRIGYELRFLQANEPKRSRKCFF